MKTISGGEKHGFPDILTNMIFLFLFAASSIFAAYSPAMAQDTAADQSNSKEGKGADQPEPKKAKLLGPADEFNRGVPRSSLKGYLKAARDGDFERAAKYLDMRYLPGRMASRCPLIWVGTCLSIEKRSNWVSRNGATTQRTNKISSSRPGKRSA